MNGANEEILSQELNNQKFICIDNKLKDNSEDPPSRQFYQLTLSDDLCIGIDGKYDLNIDRAPVLSIVAKNKGGFATPIAFAVKNNIPCAQSNCDHLWYYEDLPNNSGFRRVTVCSSAHLWNPVAMIDKHRPTELGVDGLLRGTIICCNKEKIKKDIQNNWMCDEWCMQFIDAGRLPVNNEFFWTTNNFTERINRTIEATSSGKQTVLTFVERFRTVTTFNAQSRELPPKISQDMLGRLNLGRLYFLLGMVERSDHLGGCLNWYFYWEYRIQNRSDILFVSSLYLINAGALSTP
ncbi:hypothetical protein RclHR1_01110020 [Rhizophagus clarus]|uniref:Uncharacterized protein n=1 Tax=Rhizophagus clarus TaxID=94130 RepID=A0A2Z6Q4Z6_9GLOM|nr:hypothetical protein RclHR1_01110020 [Rhizophagus clarus]